MFSRNIHAAHIAWRRQAAKGDALMVWSGLSVTVCGRLLKVHRDEAAQIAEVVCERLPRCERQLTETEASAVRTAARLLVEKAQRFLGAGWRVVPLELEAGIQQAAG